jgi:hypothetical protein
VKTWSPDTCPAPGCIIEELYDGAGNITGGGVVVRKCAAHALVADGTLYDTLLNKENRRKNLIHKALVETGSLNLGELQDGAFVFKPGVDFTWAFSGVAPNRAITISVTGATLTTAQRNTITNYCNTNFGVGTVVLV